jgi:3-hydroxymyristoyl/3-hydroxydecanoyl-(acyl carrier protein) dehydratase
MNQDLPNANDTGRRKWHILTVLPESTPGEFLARATAEPTSPWFSGHFPGEPILPGIAQIHMVLETIQQAEKRDLLIAGLRRVRFRQVIQPGDEIAIRVRPRESEASAYSFQAEVGEEVACSGILITAAATGA